MIFLMIHIHLMVFKKNTWESPMEIPYFAMFFPNGCSDFFFQVEQFHEAEPPPQRAGVALQQPTLEAWLPQELVRENPMKMDDNQGHPLGNLRE